MNKRSAFIFLLLVALASGLAFLRVPLASSQGVTLVAAEVQGGLPLTDPNSALWNESTAIAVPLSAQTVVRPMLPDARVRAITARALHNGQQIAFLVEWDDATQSDSNVRVQDFADAVAVQFPLAAGQPFFCMGQPGGNVNIWHWKADWQADIAARQDMHSLYPNMYVDQYPFMSAVDAISAAVSDYTDANYAPALAAGNLFASALRASPVEDVIAGGFGSITAQPADGQNVHGSGVWSAGKWRVIFTRDLTSAEPDDVSFVAGQVYSMAFAAWDGAHGERNGQKSTSQWVSLQLGGQPAGDPGQGQTRPAQPQAPFDIMGIVFVFGPMFLVAGLILGAAGGVFLLSLLAGRMGSK